MTETVLITGGAKRIGRAIALAAAGAGCDVALHYHTSRDEAERLAERIRAGGRRCECLEADLGDPGEAPGLIDAAFEAMGDLTVLVNNASTFEPGGFLETDEAALDRGFNVNFKSPFLLSRAFAQRCRRGQIVNLLDTRITRTMTDHFAYTLAKKSLHELTRMAAKALAPRIRVNAICPGLILPAPGTSEASMDRLVQRVPMQTRGRPEDVADAFLFLLRNPYVTGEAIMVDGGENLR